MKDFLTIHEDSHIPKYRQIVNAVIDNISRGRLHIDDKIPSINTLSETFFLSRDTVEKAYNILKDRKVITSVKGKGFYVTRTQLIAKVNILFLINKLRYKMQIYNAFINTMGANGHTDLYITIVKADLVSLVKQLRDNEYVIGTDIGIISYNDTPLNDLLGITVISTDFGAMGRTTAELILEKRIARIKNPFRLIERESL